MELFGKIVNLSQPLTILAKNLILDVWLGLEYASAFNITTKIYLLKVSKRNTGATCEICSKLIIRLQNVLLFYIYFWTDLTNFFKYSYCWLIFILTSISLFKETIEILEQGAKIFQRYSFNDELSEWFQWLCCDVLIVNSEYILGIVLVLVLFSLN